MNPKSFNATGMFVKLSDHKSLDHVGAQTTTELRNPVRIQRIEVVHSGESGHLQFAPEGPASSCTSRKMGPINIVT